MPFLGKEEIENRFGFHKGIIEGPNATLPKHAELRRKFVEFAEYLDRALPDGGRPKVLVSLNWKRLRCGPTSRSPRLHPSFQSSFSGSHILHGV